MHDTSFQILYLGEDLAWTRLSDSLAHESSNLKIHRTQSLNDFFVVLADGNWQAAAIDVHARNFQGLHYVDKIRSEYPVFPILALYSFAEDGLALKAINSGASRCLLLEQLTSATVHSAIVSCLSEQKSQAHLRKVSSMQVTLSMPEPSPLVPSKNLVISHALNNLLCVISANADVLSEHVESSGPCCHSLAEIKRAAKSASDLTRLLK